MQSFQSTLPRRERPILDVQQPARHDFNPRSREGSDDYGDETSAVKFISIHAPAKGATYRLAARRKADRHFNPRSREGSDGGATVKYTRYCGISIHAPAKEVKFQSTLPRYRFQSTLPRRERRLCAVYAEFLQIHFNPRSREGSDLSFRCVDRWKILFQSTLPRRERHATLQVPAAFFTFQSTLPRRERRQTFAT